MAAVDTSWDVLICEADTLSAISFCPDFINIQINDQINDVGSGSLTVDYDSDWLSDFYSSQSEYPWDGNYAVQVKRNGVVVFSFLVEEASIDYVASPRAATMTGRGLAACLDWAIILPSEDIGDVDNPSVTGWTDGASTLPNFFTRIFGDVASGTEASPTYPASGGGAFVTLFNEANSGNAQTWTNVITNSPDRDSAVSWPLQLSANLSQTVDSNNVAFSNTASYPADEMSYVFSVPIGITMLDALGQLSTLTANSQWYVNGSGTVFFSKQVGTDRTSQVLISTPNVQTAQRSISKKTLRTYVYASNAFDLARETDAASTATYGRREAFVGHDGTEEYNNVVANDALQSLIVPQDELTFGFVEGLTNRCWLDFEAGDTVRIEFAPGIYQNRQIASISASIDSEVRVEVTVGEVVSSALADLQRRLGNGQFSGDIGIIDYREDREISAPTNLVATTVSNGVLSYGVNLSWNVPEGFGGQIAYYEVTVESTSTQNVKAYNSSTGGVDGIGANETLDNEVVVVVSVATSIDLGALTRFGGSYRASVRAVTFNSKRSPASGYATFTLPILKGTLLSGYLASSNYVGSSQGWAISADGDVEFNDGKFRGSVFVGGTEIVQFPNHTFRQNNQPSSATTGDIWIDTDDSDKMYTYTGSAWERSTNTVYAQSTQPGGSGYRKGDIWYDTSNNKVYVWSGSSWVVGADGTEDAIETGTTITSGGITLSNGGSIKGGKTAYASGTGFFLGYSSGYKFDIGTTSTYLRWTGSTLDIANASLTLGSTTLSSNGNATFAGSVQINGGFTPSGASGITNIFLNGISGSASEGGSIQFGAPPSASNKRILEVDNFVGSHSNFNGRWLRYVGATSGSVSVPFAVSHGDLSTPSYIILGGNQTSSANQAFIQLGDSAGTRPVMWSNSSGQLTLSSGNFGATGGGGLNHALFIEPGSSSTPFRTTMQGVYNNTATSFSYYVGIDANGALRRSTSSEIVKRDITSLNGVLSVAGERSRLYSEQMDPVLYKLVAEGEQGDWEAGFIAERVAEVFPELASVAPDGINDYRRDGLVAHAIAEIRNLRRDLDFVMQALWPDWVPPAVSQPGPVEVARLAALIAGLAELGPNPPNAAPGSSEPDPVQAYVEADRELRNLVRESHPHV